MLMMHAMHVMLCIKWDITWIKRMVINYACYALNGNDVLPPFRRRLVVTGSIIY